MTRVLSTIGKTGGPVYDPGDWYDEALEPDGAVRRPYADVLAALAEANLTALTARARQHLSREGVTFGTQDGSVPFHVDPVPRIFERSERELVESGLEQRARALNAFIADVYGDRDTVRAGRIPARVLESADHFEPWMLGGEIQHRQALPGDSPAHAVRVTRGSLLERLLGRTALEVNSFHHQSVAKLGTGLRVVAKAPDGVVEGIEARDGSFVVGVQWHAEAMAGRPEEAGLFAGLVEAAQGFEGGSRRVTAA